MSSDTLQLKIIFIGLLIFSFGCGWMYIVILPLDWRHFNVCGSVITILGFIWLGFQGGDALMLVQRIMYKKRVASEDAEASC